MTTKSNIARNVAHNLNNNKCNLNDRWIRIMFLARTLYSTSRHLSASLGTYFRAGNLTIKGILLLLLFLCHTYVHIPLYSVSRARVSNESDRIVTQRWYVKRLRRCRARSPALRRVMAQCGRPTFDSFSDSCRLSSISLGRNLYATQQRCKIQI